jgi:hypothetical protein
MPRRNKRIDLRRYRVQVFCADSREITLRVTQLKEKIALLHMKGAGAPILYDILRREWPKLIEDCTLFIKDKVVM